MKYLKKSELRENVRENERNIRMHVMMPSVIIAEGCKSVLGFVEAKRKCDLLK